METERRSWMMVGVVQQGAEDVVYELKNGRVIPDPLG
jgi:hypothetical protein